MRIISEQELKNILDKHGKWVRNEEGGERADLRSADLRSADLMVFRFQKHQAYYTFDGMLRIGCHFHKGETWLKDFKAVGIKEGYTPIQVRMYGCFIKTCAIHQKSLKK